MLIEAHGGYEGGYFRGYGRVEHLFVCNRVDASRGYCGSHCCKLPRGDSQRALPGVEVKAHVGVVVYTVVVFQQPRYGAVVEVGGALAAVKFVDELRR